MNLTFKAPLYRSFIVYLYYNIFQQQNQDLRIICIYDTIYKVLQKARKEVQKMAVPENEREYLRETTELIRRELSKLDGLKTRRTRDL